MKTPASFLWWFDQNDDRAYTYSDPNEEYDREYFNSEHHPNDVVAQQLYNYMQQTYKMLFGKYFSSVIEFGSGGGEITKQFHDDNLDYLAIEPTKLGIEKLINNGVEPGRILQADIRYFNNLGKAISRQFDLAMCTEVAEHIEPWFACKVVEACSNHSDRVWFSAATNSNTPHYHHVNVAPIKAWDNIFALFGYDYIVLENKFDRAERLYHRD